MTILGTALCENATKVLLLGSGELGKEVAIECQRLGLEVIAADRYAQAPAMHVAHRSYVIDMLDAPALKSLIKQENPHFIVPEIEAIATQALIELENEGYRVVPCANATQITMNRESIRRLAAQELSLPCSTYRFADNEDEFRQAVNDIGLPCIVKPIMSSSGKGQSLIHNRDQLAQAWRYSQLGGRTGEGKVIVEGFIKFDFEITLLTIHAVDGIHFCAPIGHHQENGDYRESWQPQKMSEAALNKAKSVASSIVKALGGYGLFGVELFVSGDDVIFNEISPRPHDTGMVTLLSQNLSEFALHVRAFLGLPIGNIRQYGACASAAILPKLTSKDIKFGNLDSALQTNTQIRLFSKPNIEGTRRLGVTLAQADSVEQAIFAAKTVAENVEVMP